MACLGRNTNNTKHLLAILLCASSVLCSGWAHALSIGKPQLDSALGQVLQVRIPIRGFAEGTGPQDYTIGALPSTDYAKLGLAVPPFPWDQLNFRWLNATSDSVEMLISSEQRIAEPVINILLEIRGPDRRWVKQVDLLLDPTIQAPRPVVTNRRPASRRQAIDPQTPPNNYGPVQAGEVLSIIAQKVRPDPKIPLAQMVQALIDANLNAFPEGPQSLRAGAMLKVPQLHEIQRAAVNKPLMQPTTQNLAKRTTTSTEAKTEQPSLPSYRYANGAMFPLSVMFLSYEAIKPIDLKPYLVSLEQSEPPRFKADWTLTQAPASNRLLDSTAINDTKESQLEANAASTQFSELNQRRSGDSTQAQDNTAPAEPNSSLRENTSNPLSQTAQQTPKAEASAAQQEVPTNNKETRWWLWLAGIFIALVLYRWRQKQSTAQEELAPRIPYTKQARQPPIHPPVKNDTAETVAPPITDQPCDETAPPTSEPTDEGLSDEDVFSEQEEQQLRKDIRAMLNANLSSEAERKLKVAEALAERGNHLRAKQMVTEVQDALSDM